MAIRITSRVSIDEDELSESFVRASGPGGQNVNKVSTAVELRFDAASSPNLPEDVRVRLITMAGQKATRDGVIIITADTHRSQERNRATAREKLVALIAKACERPKPRIATRPSRAAKARRADSKTKRGAIKKLRGGRPDAE
jgi:ribosome-associated protein